MDRRALLAAVGTALAGCGSDSSQTTTPPPTTTGGPALAVDSFEVESPVQIGSPVEGTITVRNDGDTRGTFTSTIEAKFGTGDWTETGIEVSIPVDPGATTSRTISIGTAMYIRPATYRLVTTDTRAFASFVGAEIGWGTAYRLPNGLELTVMEPHFDSVYRYQTDDGEQSAMPPEGEQWAIYAARARNTTDESLSAPGIEEIILHREDDEFRGEIFDGDRDRYRGGTLAPGEETAGEIPCDIPSDIGLMALRVEYARNFPDGDVEVTWRTPG